jgi:hypothetical protein
MRMSEGIEKRSILQQGGKNENIVMIKYYEAKMIQFTPLGPDE